MSYFNICIFTGHGPINFYSERLMEKYRVKNNTLVKIFKLSVFHNFASYYIWLNGDTFKIKIKKEISYLIFYFKHEIQKLLLRSCSTLMIRLCLITNRKHHHVPGNVLPQFALSHSCAFVLQLQEKFEHLKRVQQEETMKLEDKRRQLEEDIMDFYKLKPVSGTLQTQVCTNIKKEKDHKKQLSLTIMCIIEPYRSQVYLSVRLSLQHLTLPQLE